MRAVLLQFAHVGFVPLASVRVWIFELLRSVTAAASGITSVIAGSIIIMVALLHPPQWMNAVREFWI
jgi:hypothetical protein